MKRQQTTTARMRHGRQRISRIVFPLCALYTLVHGAALQAQSTAPALEQITVTAKKRNQALRRVDISMAVIEADTLDALQVRTLTEVAPLVEGVQMFEDFPGASIPTWIIRGVGLQDFNSNNTPTAGIYSDGSYQVASVMGASALFDLAQIEVLKGPQGGLYGRNTSGGAVLLNTNRASLEGREGYLNVGYGSWEQATLEGAVNIPMTSTSAVRFAARTEQGNDGWQRSLSNGRVHGEKDRWDLRSWFLFEPSDNLTLQWKIQGGADDSDIALGRSIGLYAKSSTPTLCAAILQGRRDDASCINWGGVNRLRRNVGEMPENISQQSDDGAEVFSDTINRQYNDYVNSVLDIAWQGDAVELRSISSYDDFGYGVELDLDGSAGEYGHRVSYSDMKVFSQEFRILSRDQAPLQWLLGAYWSVEDFEENRDFNLRANGLVGMGQGRLYYDQNTESAAIYGDLAYRFADQWSINGSLRYTEEQKEYRNGSLHIPLTTPPTYLVRNLSSDYDLDSRTSGAISLNWLPSDDTLGYLKFSRGFKSGGFYGGFPFNPAEVQAYDEETINAVELGVKQSYPEQALQVNAALFYYDYADVQGYIREVNPITGTGIDRLANQGDARHRGAEFQMRWSPLSRLDLEFGLAWLDAEFVSTGKTTTNLLRQQVEITGQRPYAPRWSTNALLRYRQTVASRTLLDWTVAWNYRTDFGGAQSTPAEEAVNHLPGYGLVNLGLNLSRNDQPWKGGLWVRNALDKIYRTRVKNDGLSSFIEMFGEPRSVGIDLHYQF